MVRVVGKEGAIYTWYQYVVVLLHFVCLDRTSVFAFFAALCSLPYLDTPPGESA